MKYYVYALDISSEICITAALSCPDEKTAKWTYREAFRKVRMNNNDEFRFGFTSKKSQVIDDDFDIPSATDVRLKIEFISLPMRGFPRGMKTHRIFNIGKFEDAELETKRYLSNPRCSQRDIKFMRCVKKAMEELANVSDYESASESAIDEITVENATTSVPESTTEKDAKDREKRIKEAAKEFYTRKVNGESVTKKCIAVKHGFEKETNILSKLLFQEKYGFAKIEDAIENAEKVYGSIPDIVDSERSRLLNLIYNTIKRPSKR